MPLISSLLERANSKGESNQQRRHKRATYLTLLICNIDITGVIFLELNAKHIHGAKKHFIMRCESCC